MVRPSPNCLLFNSLGRPETIYEIGSSLPLRWQIEHAIPREQLCGLMPDAKLPIVTVPRMSRCSPLLSAHLLDCLAESAGLGCRILVQMATTATMVSTASK